MYERGYLAGGGGAHFVQVVIQSKLILSKVQSLDKNIQDVCNII